MKVLGLIGSPRKRGNTDLVVDQILKGAQTKGYMTEKVYLKKYISLCTDCRVCKTGDFECKIDDVMQQIYPKMAEADVIVFGTPVYWYGPTAMMKMLLDRMRRFVENKKLVGSGRLLWRLLLRVQIVVVRWLRCFVCLLCILAYNWWVRFCLRRTIREKRQRIRKL